MNPLSEVTLLVDPSDAAKTRNAAIDHIRIILTAIVIFHHVAIVYGGSGGWYWREQPNASNEALLMFNAIDQAYFMGFFFLLAVIFLQLGQGGFEGGVNSRALYYALWDPLRGTGASFR
jgi:hypothetical protein